MKTRTEILSDLIKEHGYRSYLEIGMGDGANFRAIKAEKKTGVDPVRAFGQNNVNSDDFFRDNTDKFDIVYIDGLHTAEQVERDMLNAWSSLNSGGVMVLHDVNPPDEVSQEVPRKQVIWTGNVWRSAVGFISKYGDKIKWEYIPEKYGMLAIYKSGHKIKPGFSDMEMPYSDFEKNKNSIYDI